MKKNPLTSYVLSAYNEEEHIEECINSLLNQDYENLEILVTDDGSEDKTLEILKNISNKNKKLKVFTQQHLGMAQGWNNSFSHSKGEIIIMFGADMVASKEFTTKLIHPIIHEDCVGSSPKIEMTKNIENIWARAKIRKRTYKKNFLAISRKAWIKVGGADTRRGYDADATFADSISEKPRRVDVEISHYLPATFSEFWKQSVWIGRSMNLKNRTKLFLSLPLMPFIIIYKSVKKIIEDPFLPLIFFMPIYNSLKYLAFYIGATQFILFGERKR